MRNSLLPGVVLLTGNGQGTWQISEESDLSGASPTAQNADAVAADFNNDNRADFALITQDQNANTFEFAGLYQHFHFLSEFLPAQWTGRAFMFSQQGPGSSEHFTAAAATGLTGPSA